VGAAIVGLFVCGSTAAQFSAPTQSIGVRPEFLKDVRIEQKLNAQVPLDLSFVDENGKAVQLKDYFQPGKPVVLSLAYYTCPMLCTQVQNGILNSLKLQSFDAGKDFEVLTVSIDPTDKPVLAKAKQEMYTGIYGRPTGAEGWHFLTGQEPQIRALADAVGFRYAYDPESHQYAHASGIMILTPDGKVSRYFYGIEYHARDMRLGLVEASGGTIGTPVDELLLLCCQYDPHTGRYGVLVSRILKFAAGLTVVLMGIAIFFLARSEHYSMPARKS
jgi:protein SCO1